MTIEQNISHSIKSSDLVQQHTCTISERRKKRLFERKREERLTNEKNMKRRQMIQAATERLKQVLNDFEKNKITFLNSRG